MQYGQIPLDEFCADLPRAGRAGDRRRRLGIRSAGFLAEGADIVVYSAHKFLGGPTAGIVAGRKDLVRAAFLQNRGIGRGMKVGKESIVGTIAALEAWGQRDHAGDPGARDAATSSSGWTRFASVPGRQRPRSFPIRPTIRSTA